MSELAECELFYYLFWWHRHCCCGSCSRGLPFNGSTKGDPVIAPRVWLQPHILRCTVQMHQSPTFPTQHPPWKNSGVPWFSEPALRNGYLIDILLPSQFIKPKLPRRYIFHTLFSASIVPIKHHICDCQAQLNICNKMMCRKSHELIDAIGKLSDSLVDCLQREQVSEGPGLWEGTSSA